MSGAGWRVTIDNRSGLNEITAELDRTGGYAITHAGRLEREDGQPFSRGQAREMLKARSGTQFDPRIVDAIAELLACDRLPVLALRDNA